jgi:hypothetical protein
LYVCKTVQVNFEREAERTCVWFAFEIDVLRCLTWNLGI